MRERVEKAVAKAREEGKDEDEARNTVEAEFEAEKVQRENRRDDLASEILKKR
jgi:hypothetical protein